MKTPHRRLPQREQRVPCQYFSALGCSRLKRNRGSLSKLVMADGTVARIWKDAEARGVEVLRPTVTGSSDGLRFPTAVRRGNVVDPSEKKMGSEFFCKRGATKILNILTSPFDFIVGFGWMC